MDDVTDLILAAMEQAAISGLCREGQLEIALQEARKHHPELSDQALRDLVAAADQQRAR